MANDIVTAGAQTAGDVVGSIFGYYGNKSLQQDAQSFAREMMDKQNKINIDNQLHSAQRQVDSFKMAGLSPALAANGSFSPVATSVPSSGTNSVSKVDFNGIGAIATMAQAKLAESQAKNLDADTELKQQAKTYNEDEDATLTANLPMFFGRLSQDFRFDKPMRDAFAAAAEDVRRDGVSQGSLRGLMKFIDMTNAQQESAVRSVKSELDWSVIYSQVHDDRVVSALARMPQAQKDNLVSLSSHYMAQVALAAQYGETEHAKRQHIAADIQKIVREAQSIFHKDNAQMVRENDIPALLWNIGGHAADVLGRLGTAAVLKR